METGWNYDAYEYVRGPRAGQATKLGRPTCIEERVFTMYQLQTLYAKHKSIRKVAQILNVSPTTIKKYLKGVAKDRGRPIQPKSWEAQIRSNVHAWFVEHKSEQLPRSTRELSRLSGFSKELINRYLWSRKKAMESYLASLPRLNEVIFVMRDINGGKVPSNLIASYVYSIERISGIVTISCVLKMGGHRIIKLPFRDLETALRGVNPDLPMIGLVKPVKPNNPAWLTKGS